MCQQYYMKSIAHKHQNSKRSIKQQQNSQLYKSNQNIVEKVSMSVDERQGSPPADTEINIDTEANYNNQIQVEVQKDPIFSKTFTNFRSEIVRRDSNAQLVRSNSKISMNQIVQSQRLPKDPKTERNCESKPRNSSTAINNKRTNKVNVPGLLRQRSDKKIQRQVKQLSKIDDLSASKKNQVSSRSLTSHIGRVNIRVKGKSNSKVSQKLNFIVKNKDFVVKKKQNTQSLSRSKTSNTKFSFNPKKSVPDQIIDYLKKREDVQIMQYFQEYKKQFFTKSKTLQDYIYNSNQPQKIKNTYMNENDNHFKCGLETIMLKLFRNGTIVPKSYDNLRQEAVEEIEKWVIGWIHRKILYGKLIQDEQNQVLMVEDSLKHLQDYQRLIENENTSF